jgi:hypothetical protein
VVGLYRWRGAVLYFIGDLAFANIAYYAGTPTTTTIHECHPARGWRADCTASWSVGGQSHTGTINVDHDYPPSSSLDVRAFAGVAYASPPCIVFSRTCFRSSYMLIAIGAIAVCAVVSIVWRRWWRRPTDRPWEKRTVADMSRFTDQV